MRRAGWLVCVPGLLAGCLMSRVEFSDTEPSGPGGSSTGATGATDSGGSDNQGGSSSTDEGGAPTSDAGEASTGGTVQGGTGGTPSAGSGGSGGTNNPAGCGDGVFNPGEQCDDRNKTSGDGCSNECQLEKGFICDVVGFPCHEPPSCAAVGCPPVCGDGHVSGTEDCDDGNDAPGDGCSASCQVETGWTCAPTSPPAQITLPVTYRDFIADPMPGNSKHPDFNAFAGTTSTAFLVDNLLVDGLPDYTGLCEVGTATAANAVYCPNGAQTTSLSRFEEWYRDTPGVNLTFHDVMTLARQGSGALYEFDGGGTFAPLTGRGFDSTNQEVTVGGQNFGFTTELRFWFVLKGEEALTFTGDDDVWVYLNNELAIDIGGLHPKVARSFALDDTVIPVLGLTKGTLYEVAVFHAERAPTDSNFKLSLNGFAPTTSACTQ